MSHSHVDGKQMSLVSQLRAWLVFFRAHTAILETPMAVLGASVALGTIFHWDMVYWIVFGVAYHFIGYGMNSYADWIKGYDKNDPHKQHHPLNTGEISPTQARHVIFGLLVLYIVYALWLGDFSIVAGVGVAFMLAAGVSYNYFGKITKHKYILIAVVHTMVFVYPYITYTTQYNIVVVLGAAAFFIHHVYQIAISGDIKDIEQDESSLIRSWGADVVTLANNARVMKLGLKVKYVSVVLVFLEIGLAAAIYAITISRYPYRTLFILPIGLTAIWMLREHVKLTADQPYRRNESISIMSRKELAGFSMMAAAFIPLIGVLGFLAIIAASLAYFLPISKFMWGNWLRPDV